MTLPETDLHRIRTWARGRAPEHLWPELNVEADVADRYVDIVEERLPWDGVGEHTRFPLARLRYTKATGLGAIHWRDRHLECHEYKRKRPAKNVQALLDHIETSGGTLERTIESESVEISELKKGVGGRARPNWRRTRRSV